MPTKLYCILLLLPITQVKAQSNIKVGESCPPINITDWVINIPQDKSLKGKNIVLEFWATWCWPCIEAVPHLNKLQSTYKDRNVYFISITDESIQKVSRVLKRVNFKSMVVSDQTQKTQIFFGDGKNGLEYYPLTVLIDKNGILEWIGEPNSLTETVMNDFLQLNKPIHFPDSLNKNMPELKEEIEEDKRKNELYANKDLMYFLKLKKSNKKESSMTNAQNKFIVYTGTSFLDIYSNLLNFDKKDILSLENMVTQKFNLLYKNNRAKQEDIIKLEQDILYILGLQKRIEEKIYSVLSFSINDSTLLEKTLAASFSSKSDAGDKVIFTNYTVPALIKNLNSYSTERLFFQGEYKGNFDFIIEVKSTDALIDSLSSYGL